MGDQMRAEFEEWAVHQGYDLTRDDVVVAYASEETDRVWAAWQASRAALVVELPARLTEGDDYADGWNHALTLACGAARVAGVRVKP